MIVITVSTNPSLKKTTLENPVERSYNFLENYNVFTTRGHDPAGDRQALPASIASNINHTSTMHYNRSGNERRKVVK